MSLPFTAERLRAELTSETDEPLERFSPDMVAGLAEPARRYLLHAIRPGTPQSCSVTLAMAGEIRLGPRLPWLFMTAQQVLAPPRGFLWEARIARLGVSFVGADSYAQGQGQTVFRLWNRIPMVRAIGPDVSRSARGRLAIESIWNPTSLLPQRGASWAAIDEWTAQATVTIDGEAIPLTLTIGPGGNLQSITMDRWGNVTTNGHYTPIPFGANVFDERTFGGYTVPSHLGVSWWYGADREFQFLRACVTQATYCPSDREIGPLQ